MAPALAGMVLHRTFLLGEPATPELITALIDQIVLPACHPQAHVPHEEKETS